MRHRDDGAVEIAEMLKVNPRIAWIRLAGNCIGERGAVALAQAVEESHSIGELYLGSMSSIHRNAFGPVGAKALAKALTKNKSLGHLGLAENDIQDDGAVALAEALTSNNTLRWLRLAENGIGDRGAAAFADLLEKRMCFLKVLGLFHNEIGPEGARRIAGALKVNRRLDTLGLGQNPFGQEGTDSLLQALEYNDTLIFLDHNLFGKAITEEQSQAFAAKITGNRTENRIRKIWTEDPSERSSADWKRWIKNVCHDEPPSNTLPAQVLEQIQNPRPSDVFLVHTGAQTEDYIVPMRERFQSHGLRCFLDRDMRDAHGPPPSQMRLALETCRFAVCVISKEFLGREDPCDELEYAFDRMGWIQENFEWRSMPVILFNISVDEYKDFRKNKRPTLPNLGKSTVMYEWRDGGNDLFDSWEQVCDTVKADLITADTDKRAVQKWTNFLMGWESHVTGAGGLPLAGSLYCGEGGGH